MSERVFREITPYSECVDHWKDVTINAGASQSTLQDIKLPECAGCFAYSNSGEPSSLCSNRFIYWRTNHDIIELVEVSLDITLKDNHLRLKFQNTPILRGVSVHEYRDKVILLVPTVSAIHKLVFPHPNSVERDVFPSPSNLVLPSVFFNSSHYTLRNRSHFFVLNHVSLGIPLPHTSCSWLDNDFNATFILANSAGSVLMVTMTERNEVEITTTELMKTGTISRLLNGLVPSVIRSTRNEVALSIVCHQDNNDVLIFALFSDLQIRVWSHKKQDCISIDSITNYDYDKRLSSGNFTAHQCHLRKSAVDSAGEFFLGVYIPIPHQKIFYIFNPVIVHDQCKLKLVTILHQTSHGLVDFCIGENRLWSLWLSCDNQPVVLTAFLDSERETNQPSWIPVNLENQVSRTIDFSTSSPKDAYLKEIFKVGRFLPSTIAKAISIYDTSRNSFLSSLPQKIEELRNFVIDSVEKEILMKCGDIESNEHEYLEISAACWDRFFSYCIQYHEVGMKPLGIASDPNTGCVILIKKNFYSLLCPCDGLEAITSPQLRSTSILMGLLDDSDMKLYHGLKSVLECMDLIRESVDEKLLFRFEDKISSQYSPIKYASEIRRSLDLETNSHFYRKLQSFIPSNNAIMACLEYLLLKLDLTPEARENIEEPCRRYATFGNSSSGIAALCAGLTHFARQRFEFCRDLLLFEIVLYESDVMDSEQLESLLTQSTVIPQTVMLVRSYFMVMWCTQYECVPVSPATQDAAFKQFCLLDLPEFTSANLTNIHRRQTVSHLFFQEDGGAKARRIMEMKNLSTADTDDWESHFPSLVIAAATLLWPLDGNVTFAEFLFARCQHSPLQEYDRLLTSWSADNKQFLNFLVASSFLIQGDSEKATRIILDVSKDIESESILCNKIIRGRYAAGTSVTSSFYMKVIQMFEQFSLSDCIVKLATAALNMIDEEADANTSIFYSVLFKHNLNLEKSEEAFDTLIKNPDSSRRKDCLRQLVVKLCERRQFQKIIQLSYLAFEEEIITILESRARCSDLCHNTSFYRVLSSLHIHHKKFRKAGAIMYELAMRFGREVATLKGLQKQVNCYVTTISCLHLAEPQYAWIVKPCHTVPDNTGDSKKRDLNGEEVSNATRSIKIDVLGLDDIMKEYALVKARLTHAQKLCNAPDLAITPLTAEETVALLLNAGLFDAAINLSKTFSLSLVPVFEVLTFKCLNSTLRSDVYSTKLDDDKFSRQSDFSKDYTTENSKNRFQLWNLLRKNLLEHEAAGKSDLHRCVAEKLLSDGALLPAWLKLSYQKRNFTELLALYISHGLVEESVVIVCKYIKAILGVRKEDFDLKFSLHINSPAVWLPYTYIDMLLNAVETMQDDEYYKELYQLLHDTLDEYFKTVESVTASKLMNALN